MYKAIIVDDERSGIDNLTIMINRYCPRLSVSGSASNLDKALEIITADTPAILFLDIEMPEGNGFELLKRLAAPDFEVIFVTAHLDYAIQAIRYSAIDYLLKPINSDELIDAVNKAILNFEKKMQNERLQNLLFSMSTGSQMRIAIPGNRETIFVNPSTILFCKAENNYSYVFLENGTKLLSTRPIFEFEELLSSRGFTRCHQSYVVNLNFVEKWIKTDGDRLAIPGGHEIPISRNNRQKVLLAIKGN